MIPGIDFTVDDAFKTPYLEEVFNGIAPEQPDDRLLQEKFFPLSYPSESDIVTLHSHGYTGRTPATTPQAEVPTFALPPLFIKDYQFGYWGEGAHIDKPTLQRAEESKTPFFTVQGIVNQFLQGMAYRNNQLFEWTSGQVVWTGSFAINANGVVYTYSDGVPSFYRLDMTDAGFDATYWTKGGLWSSASTCTPLNDIREMVRYAAKLGLKIEEMIFNSKVAGLIEDSDEVKAWIQKNPALSANAITASFVIQELAKLKDVAVTVDDRTHLERAIVMANATSAATVLEVDDISNFTANDYVIVKQGKDQARVKVSSTSTTGLKKYVTIAAGGAGFALTAKQAVIDIGVRYAPDNKVLFKTSKQRCSGWMILPDAVRAGDPLVAKIHLWSEFKTKSPNYWRELGNYFKGGIINREPGNYLTLKVAA